MSWVVIDKEKCTGCGICAVRCTRCFTDNEGEIKVDSNEETCILCGHCVSLCPAEAITHHELNMDDFIEFGKETSLDTSNFIQFLRERRSHRHFTEKKIPQRDLETLVDVCRWAPTGSNVQNVEIIVYQEPERVQKLSNLVIDYFNWISDRVKQKLARLEAAGKQDTEDYRFTLRGLEAGSDLTKARESGLDPIFYRAPVLMIFHSISPTSAPKDNCVLAAHTVALTARTMGIESCYIGILEMAANYYPPLREELKLPPGHMVFDAMILGYPELKFLRSVHRRPLKVRWE